MKARRGLFGEVMAGLFVEAYQVVGAHRWTIPIYLFRYHAEVEAYIFDLARDWEKKDGKHFPQSVKAQFAVLASWAPQVKPGNWPDADMLPLGTLGPVRATMRRGSVG
jgi:hypothetical protein